MGAKQRFTVGPVLPAAAAPRRAGHETKESTRLLPRKRSGDRGADSRGDILRCFRRVLSGSFSTRELANGVPTALRGGRVAAGSLAWTSCAIDHQVGRAEAALASAERSSNP